MGNQQPTSTCYLSYEGCLCNRLYVGFQKHHTKSYFGSFADSTFQPTDKIILYSCSEPIMALFVEDMYQRCWQVRSETRFVNKQIGKFSHQVNIILDTPHGGNLHDENTREKISNTMIRKRLGTANPDVRLAGNAANRGKRRDEAQRLRIRAGTAMSHLRRGRYSKASTPLTKEDKKKLWDIIEEAQRLGVYSVPSSEGKREAPRKDGDEDIVCSTGKPVAEGNLESKLTKSTEH